MTRVLMIFVVVIFVLANHDQSSAQTIHVLLLSDTGDDRRDSDPYTGLAIACEATIREVSRTFARLVPQHRYKINVRRTRELDGERNNWGSGNILAWVRDYDIARNDTLVFLYHGHGGRNLNNRHYLVMPDGSRLYSSDLQDEVKKKRCGLSLIITDSCNVSLEDLPEPAPAPKRGAPFQDWDAKRDGMAPVMEELFINQSGLLHTNASWPGNFSYSSVGRNGCGSWYFQSLLGYLNSCPTGRPCWHDIDRMQDRNLNSRFELSEADLRRGNLVAKNQEHAYPITWSYPQSTIQISRFGVVGNDNVSSRGVRVSEIYQNSPARGILNGGETIISVNGYKIDDVEDYVEFVKRSNRNMQVTYKSRTGSIFTKSFYLNR